MKKISLLIIWLLVSNLLYSCNSKPETKQSDQETFAVKPEQVSKQDTLTLTLPKKHPTKISVKSPNGTFYIIHSEEDNIALIPYEKVDSAKSIKIPLLSTIGLTWIEGKKTQEKVFKVPGRYLIYMADDLETEPENTFHFMQSIEFH